MLFLVGLDIPQYPVFYPWVFGVGKLLPPKHLALMIVQGSFPEGPLHRLLKVIPGNQVVMLHDGLNIALNGLYAYAEYLSDLVYRPSLDEPEAHYFLAPLDYFLVGSKLVLAHLPRLPLRLWPRPSSQHR